MDQFIAGLVSGIISNTICNPFDVIRTNKQVKNHIKYSFEYLTRGITTGFLTIPSFWSIYFSSYNICKKYNDNYFSFLNGYLSSNIASTITCPLWFSRQKKHLDKNFSIINYYNKNGILSFYNGLTTTYIINSSFIVQMPIYEYLKNNKTFKNNINNDTFRIFIITSVAKTIASCVFYPFDTIRTCLRNNNTNIFNTIIELNKNPIKYYRGLNIYLFRSIPYHSITFCSYEFILKRLKKNKNKM